MKAVIRWSGGETVIEGIEPGDDGYIDDPRIVAEMNRLAQAGVGDSVTLGFKYDSDLNNLEQP